MGNSNGKADENAIDEQMEPQHYPEQSEVDKQKQQHQKEKEEEKKVSEEGKDDEHSEIRETTAMMDVDGTDKPSEQTLQQQQQQQQNTRQPNPESWLPPSTMPQHNTSEDNTTDSSDPKQAAEHHPTTSCITNTYLKEKFGEYFMSNESLQSALLKLAETQQQQQESQEESQQDNSNDTIITREITGGTPLSKPSSASLDLEWLAELPDISEEEQPPTRWLCVKGMATPFVPLLLRQYLEKPTKFNQPLIDNETFRVASDAVFAMYPDVDTTRRQKRRIDGSIWPRTVAGGKLSAYYVHEDEIIKYMTEKKQEADQVESALRKRAEEQLNKNKRPTIEELFKRTETTPRLFYLFEQNENVVSEARRRAEKRIQQLISSE